MGQSMIHPVSVVVSVSEVGLMDAGVAVTSAVSISSGGRKGSLTAASTTTLPARCTIKPPVGGQAASGLLGLAARASISANDDLPDDR